MDKRFISTTNEIADYETDKHLGIVSDRIVVGIGLYSEFFAGFTDMVGGRSQKFEDRLNELNDFLLDSLCKKAQQKKAHALIGLRTDIDEISGKGTSMFMMSGTATAVTLKNFDVQPQFDNLKKLSGISIERIILQQDINQKLSSLLEQYIKYKENGYNKQMDSHLSSYPSLSNIYVPGINTEELHKEALEVFNKTINHNITINNTNMLHIVFISMLISPCLSKELIDSYIEYCTMQNINPITELYQFLLSELEGNKNNFEKCILENEKLPQLLDTIKEPDYQLLNDYMNRLPSEYWDKLIAPLLLKYEEEYFNEDVQLIQEIILKINTLPAPCPINKGLLGITWTCKCGTKVPVDYDQCINCHRDKYGRTPDYKKIMDQVVTRLGEIIDIINN